MNCRTAFFATDSKSLLPNTLNRKAREGIHAKFTELMPKAFFALWISKAMAAKLMLSALSANFACIPLRIFAVKRRRMVLIASGLLLDRILRPCLGKTIFLILESIDFNLSHTFDFITLFFLCSFFP